MPRFIYAQNELAIVEAFKKNFARRTSRRSAGEAFFKGVDDSQLVVRVDEAPHRARRSWRSSQRLQLAPDRGHVARDGERLREPAHRMGLYLRQRICRRRPPGRAPGWSCSCQCDTDAIGGAPHRDQCAPVDFPSTSPCGPLIVEAQHPVAHLIADQRWRSATTSPSWRCRHRRPRPTPVERRLENRVPGQFMREAAAVRRCQNRSVSR